MLSNSEYNEYVVWKRAVRIRHVLMNEYPKLKQIGQDNYSEILRYGFYLALSVFENQSFYAFYNRLASFENANLDMLPVFSDVNNELIKVFDEAIGRLKSGELLNTTDYFTINFIMEMIMPYSAYTTSAEVFAFKLYLDDLCDAIGNRGRIFDMDNVSSSNQQVIGLLTLASPNNITVAPGFLSQEIDSTRDMLSGWTANGGYSKSFVCMPLAKTTEEYQDAVKKFYSMYLKVISDCKDNITNTFNVLFDGDGKCFYDVIHTTAQIASEMGTVYDSKEQESDYAMKLGLCDIVLNKDLFCSYESDVLTALVKGQDIGVNYMVRDEVFGRVLRDILKVIETGYRGSMTNEFENSFSRYNKLYESGDILSILGFKASVK